MCESVSTMVATVLALLPKIPAVVWSGVAGSLITILGVLLTNVGLSSRHKQQLQHAARESVIEREMGLRRDIYMPAIEATAIALTAIGSMTDPLIKQSDVLEKFGDAWAKISKATAIAKVETVSALGDLTDSMRNFLTDLVVIRQPIMNLHNRIVAESGVVDRAIGDNGRWIQLQTDLLLQGPLDPQKAAFLVNQIRFTQKQYEEWSAKRDASIKEIALAQVEFLKALSQRQMEVFRNASNAYVSIRSEFDLTDDDLTAVGAVLTRNAEQAQNFAQRMIAGFEAQLHPQG